MKKQCSEEITKEPKKLRKYRALNNNVILWLSLFVIFLSLAIFSLVGKENGMAIAFFVFAVISTSPMLFSPIYYVFTKKGVTIVYHFGIKEEIEWWVIRLQQNAESSYTAFIVIHKLGKRAKILSV